MRFKIGVFALLFSYAIILGYEMYYVSVRDDGSREPPPSWSYIGVTGPEHWADLSPDFERCGKGTRQSPVDLTPTRPGGLPLVPVFRYQESPLKIQNDGHTVRVKYAPGSFLKLGEEKYFLRQAHFHTPAEHRVEGKGFDLEMHLVHKNYKGETAIVGVLFRKGTANPALRVLWDHLPWGKGKMIQKTGLRFQAADLLPEDRSFYSYPGSLTTPPCREGVRWLVFRSPLPISGRQLNRFHRIIKYNARPVQPLHDRPVFRTAEPNLKGES